MISALLQKLQKLLPLSGSIGRTLLFFSAFLLVASSGAAVQDEMIKFVVSKTIGLIVVVIASGLICLIAYVRTASWLLGVKGGFIHAIGAVIAGVMLTLVLACPGGMLAYILPPAFQGVLASGVSMAGGMLGVKWVFRTDNMRALIIFTAADAATLLTLCLCVIVFMI